MSSPFSHLHVHTQFSLLDGASNIKSLFKKAIEFNQPAVAITDHGNMFGVFEFVKEAYNHKNEDGTLKVKPIVGCEFYITQDRKRKSFTKDDKDPRHHQILLAKNEEGYKNLVKLTSTGYGEGMYSKYPRIDKELIHKYHKGLIATTCCLGALVPQTILKKGEAEGENEFKWWLNIFQDDFYVELQNHGIPDQDKVNKVLLKFAKKYNVKVIASNDTHYVDKDDFTAHDILLCVNTGEKIATPANREFSDDDIITKNSRFAFPNDEFYFKDTNEMIQVFAEIPEAIKNTNEIVEKVDLLKLEKDILLPNFAIPNEFKIHTEAIIVKAGDKPIQPDDLNQWEYLKHLTYEGAANRYDELTEIIKERIEFELFTIKTMGFAGYFLIVSDFIKVGKEKGVYVGPGRGSAAGSVVAFCIGITNIDPIKYDLLFERFLNPDRKSMPDIDTDFDDEGRQIVIDYVVEKYGKNQVAQIITYGTMAAKSSIKDVARVMDLPIQESNLLAKFVPDKPGTNLKRVLTAPITTKEAKKDEKSLEEKEGFGADEIENIKKLREIFKGDTLQGKILQQAIKLEGSVRNTGIHAAGIIIAPQDLTNLIPVATSKESDLWVTQIDGNNIESAGVIKMDFLGLRTLSILKNAIKLIKINHDIVIDLNTIPLDDAKTYLLYQKGDTNSTFQFESPGMQKCLRDLQPDRLSDLIAMNALYRPGPMQYISSYIDRKHGKQAIEYDLPDMEEFLKETYGITVYQEQVMLLSQKIAGFSKGDADVLRKAMGKKQIAVLNKMKKQFIEGATEKGHPTDKLEKIWTDWEAFAQYAFNKSHSTCYAVVAYQTAYLKAHYPSEFMSAVLNNAGTIEKITFAMEECKKMNVKVLGPDINESLDGFAVNKKGEIRFGFSGIKGVGEAAIEQLLEERNKKGNYKDIFDIVKRVNLRSVNKKSIESLAYAGAFDCFNEFHRAQYFFVAPGDISGLEKIIKFGNVIQTHNSTSTNTLFGDLEMPEIPNPKISTCDLWTLDVLLGYEKEVTGMYISGHPLDNFAFEMKYLNITPLSEFKEFSDTVMAQPNKNKMFRVAGLITLCEHRLTKTGKNFGKLIIEDYTSKMEFLMWSEDYAKYNKYYEKGMLIVLEGQFMARFNQDSYSFNYKNAQLLETLRYSHVKQLFIEVSPKFISPDVVTFLENNKKKNPGSVALKIFINDIRTGTKIGLVTQGNGYRLNDELISFLYDNIDIDIKVITDN